MNHFYRNHNDLMTSHNAINMSMNVNIVLKENSYNINNIENNDLGLQRLFREPRRPRQRQGGLGLKNVAGIERLFEEPVQRRGRSRPKKVIQEQPETPIARQRRGEWSQQTKNVWENVIRLGFNVEPTGNRLSKANRNVWQQYIDNRTRQRPFIRDIQQQRFELRPLQIGRFEQIAGFDNARFQAGERAYRFFDNFINQRLTLAILIYRV